jgi:hypothetical protein
MKHFKPAAMKLRLLKWTELFCALVHLRNNVENVGSISTIYRVSRRGYVLVECLAYTT